MLEVLNPNQNAFLFPSSELEKPDMDSLLQEVPDKIRFRVNLTVEESHVENCRWVRALDSKFRSLYTTAVGLVNNGMENIRGYGRLASALHVGQQAILRKSGPFVKPTTSKGGSKPRDKLASNTGSSVAAPKNKTRSRGKGRKIQGLPPHPVPPLVSSSPLPLQIPAKSPVYFGGVEIWEKYKQGKFPPSGTGHLVDLQDHLESRKQQHSSREGDSAFHQARSKGSHPKDKGRVGQH